LVHVEAFQWILEAIAFEKQVKGWSRKKKIAFIERGVDGLVEYNKGYWPPSIPQEDNTTIPQEDNANIPQEDSIK
jgi:hypothetical protein